MIDEKFNIDLVKRHIKNLIAGNRISNAEFIEMYRTMMAEAIEKRINKLISGNSLNSIDRLIQTTVSTVLNKHVNGIINTNKDWRTSVDVESMVRAEINKQVNEIIKDNLKISFGEINIKG